MKRFNIRVYGILIDENERVLVADENRYGRTFTKFPGGGLEWGEGIEDCLRREIMEELGIVAKVEELIYVNEFFQESAFNKNDQLMSFYFRVSVENKASIPITDHKVPLPEEGEAFRWLNLNAISEDDFTFPIDKIVAEKLALR